VGTEKSMNNTKKLRSALLSSLTIIASIVLGHTAQAVDLSFKPKGTQLDNDAIRDLSVTADQPIEFKIFINPRGLALRQLDYKVEYDTRELQLIGIVAGSPVDQRGPVVIEPPSPVASFTVSNSNQIALNINPNQQQVHITTIEFRTTGELPSNGIFDFRISGASGKHNNNNNEQNIDLFTYGLGPEPYRLYFPDEEALFFQEVEVQTPEPTSILGLFSLGIIGVGATIKRQVKRNHSIEKETTEIG
jgi:hypothetical protein